MKVHKVGVAFVNNPLVGSLDWALLVIISTVMRADQSLALVFILVAFMVRHLQFELNVVADVRVLPPEQLNTDRKLTSAHLLMEPILFVFSIIPGSVQNAASLGCIDCRIHAYPLLTNIREVLLNFFGVLGRPWISIEHFNNLIVPGRKVSLQIDIALPSVVTVTKHLAIILWLELPLEFLSGELVLFPEQSVCDAKESNNFGGPEKLVFGYLIAEPL